MAYDEFGEDPPTCPDYPTRLVSGCSCPKCHKMKTGSGDKVGKGKKGKSSK